MKKTLSILAVLALSCVGFHLYAQSTNAPAVTQPASTVVYTPGVITATPEQTASLVSAYFTPMLTAAGVTIPSGAVVRTYTVSFYADGSSQSRVFLCQSAQLPPAPRPITH